MGVTEVIVFIFVNIIVDGRWKWIAVDEMDENGAVEGRTH